VLDLASRRLLGYAMGERHDADLAVRAVEAAVAIRGQRQKVELVDRTRYRTRAEACAAILAWIAYYNAGGLAVGPPIPVTHRVGTPARPRRPATIGHGRIAPVSGPAGEVQPREQ
jgi:hypothetical protein